MSGMMGGMMEAVVTEGGMMGKMGMGGIVTPAMIPLNIPAIAQKMAMMGGSLR